MLYDPNWMPAEVEIKLEPWQQLILKAADILEQKGWIQHSFSDHGRYCVLGALNKAEGARPSNDYGSALRLEAEEKIEIYLEANGFYDIPQWNDTHGRTRKEILQTLRAVAKGKADHML